MGPPKTTLVGCWQGTNMKSPTNCSRNYRLRVEKNFGQQDVEFLNYAVTNEVCGRNEECQGNPKEMALDSKCAQFIVWPSQLLPSLHLTVLDLLKKWLSQEKNKPSHEAFGELNNKLFSQPVFKFAEYDKPFEVYTRTTGFVIGGCMAIAHESIKLDGCPTLFDLWKKWLFQESDEHCNQVFGEL